NTFDFVAVVHLGIKCFFVSAFTLAAFRLAEIDATS
ncbi:putative membrane protein, partial [Vibrio parahaemolyticus EKP-028]